MSGIEQIRQIIQSSPRGSIFFPEDFSRTGGEKMIGVSLMRLCEENMITRVAQGIYCFPKIDDSYGMGVLTPSLETIASAIAKRDHCQIAPTGSYALNRLGLSTQLQTNVVFYTNGSPRKIKVGDSRGILFKRTSEMKKFSFKNEVMQLIVAALREIGNGKVTEQEITIIKKRLTLVNDEDFNHDITLAPAWVKKLLKETR